MPIYVLSTVIDVLHIRGNLGRRRGSTVKRQRDSVTSGYNGVSLQLVEGVKLRLGGPLVHLLRLRKNPLRERTLFNLICAWSR